MTAKNFRIHWMSVASLPLLGAIAVLLWLGHDEPPAKPWPSAPRLAPTAPSSPPASPKNPQNQPVAGDSVLPEITSPPPTLPLNPVYAVAVRQQRRAALREQGLSGSTGNTADNQAMEQYRLASQRLAEIRGLSQQQKDEQLALLFAALPAGARQQLNSQGTAPPTPAASDSQLASLSASVP